MNLMGNWRVVAFWALASLFFPAMGMAAPLANSGTVDEILVRYQDSSPAYQGLKLPDEATQLLAETLPSVWSESARTRDGAFRLKLATPVPTDVARAGANRLRELPQVLYVKLNGPDEAAVAAAGRAAAASSALPVDRMIIKYRDPVVSSVARRGGSLDQSRLATLAARLGMPVAHERAMSGDAWVVRLFRAVPVDEADLIGRDIEGDPEVEYAEPDLKMQAMRVPNDPFFATSQWDLATSAVSIGGANLPPAWDLTTGATGVAVAVIDTGILPHPDLAGRYVAGYDMIYDAEVANDGDGRDADPTDPGDWITVADALKIKFSGCTVTDSSWHGTHVAGTIGAGSDNSTGIAGINWVGKVVPVRALGKCFGYESDIADAIRWASGLSVAGVPVNPNPARVLNLSLGGYSPTCSTTYQNAISSALAVGTVVVVAAGNSNASASNSTPGNCAGVITVAATQAAGARASYSNYGTAVEIAAPGGDNVSPILSTLNKGTTSPDLTPAGWVYVGYQGTSMATPHVAGIASLMLAANPFLTPSQVLTNLQSTARAFPTGTVNDCTTSICGAGIVDAGAAVQAVARATTSTELISSLAAISYGTAVTLTATVTGSAPTGTVDFRDGAASIAGCSAQSVALVSGLYKASCTTSTLAAGTHSIAAAYSGDINNVGSTSSAVTVSVTGLATTTALVSSAASVAYGTSVTLTATVTGSTPTGTVDFRDGAASIAGCSAQSVALVSGLYKATCTTSTLAAGTRSITAAYSGEGINAASTSSAVTVTVSSVATTTTLASSAASVAYGTSVTLTATVAGSTPTGTVDFRDGAASIAGCSAQVVALVSGLYKAACTTSTLTVGAHSIVAAYSGDANNIGSNSSTLTQTVTTIATTTGLGASSATAPFGSVVTFTATVSGVSPTGIVDFRDGAVSIPGCDARTLTLVSGVFRATCSTAGLALGAHNVTARYAGDPHNVASTSPALGHAVSETSAGQGSAYSRNYLQKIYVAYYGRPADAGGLLYWAKRMDAEGGSLAAVIDAFATSDEFNRRYGTKDSSALVTAIYRQTLGRDPDQGGFTYYLNSLSSGTRTLQSIALDILNGATTPPDSTVVANKLDVALYSTANEILGCPSGTELELVALVSAVNATSASVDTARAAIDTRCAAFR